MRATFEREFIGTDYRASRTDVLDYQRALETAIEILGCGVSGENVAVSQLRNWVRSRSRCDVADHEGDRCIDSKRRARPGTPIYPQPELTVTVRIVIESVHSPVLRWGHFGWKLCVVAGRRRSCRRASDRSEGQERDNSSHRQPQSSSAPSANRLPRKRGDGGVGARSARGQTTCLVPCA